MTTDKVLSTPPVGTELSLSTYAMYMYTYIAMLLYSFGQKSGCVLFAYYCNRVVTCIHAVVCDKHVNVHCQQHVAIVYCRVVIACM